MNPRWIALLCTVGAALLIAVCGGAQPSPVAQAQPSATPIPASATPAPPTATPQPTVDVAAIQTAAAATIEQQGKDATATAAPTRPPATRAPAAPTAAFTLDLRNMRYEQWGRPVRGCQLFDNNRPERKFNLEITLTNNTGMAIDDWYPDFYANNGALLLTCFYVYGGGFPPVPPGEAREVTLTTFCEPEEYVAEMRVKIDGQEIKRCFSPEGAVVACP